MPKNWWDLPKRDWEAENSAEDRNWIVRQLTDIIEKVQYARDSVFDAERDLASARLKPKDRTFVLGKVKGVLGIGNSFQQAAQALSDTANGRKGSKHKEGQPIKDFDFCPRCGGVTLHREEGIQSRCMVCGDLTPLQKEPDSKAASLIIRIAGKFLSGHQQNSFSRDIIPGIGLSEADIAGAVARGWCHKENETKEMDAVLATCITDEVAHALENHITLEGPVLTNWHKENKLPHGSITRVISRFLTADIELAKELKDFIKSDKDLLKRYSLRFKALSRKGNISKNYVFDIFSSLVNEAAKRYGESSEIPEIFDKNTRDMVTQDLVDNFYKR